MKALRKISLLLVLAVIVSLIPAGISKAATKPTAPAKITTATTGLGTDVKWSKVSNASKYRLYRREYNGTSWEKWETVVTLKATEYVDPNVNKGVKYQYRVRGYNSAGWGEYKTSKTVTAAEITQKPAACEKVDVIAEGSQVTVSWSDVKGALKYGLYRKEYDGNTWGSWVRTDYFTNTDFVDENVTPGYQYQYRVRANNKAGWGPYTTSQKVEVELPKPAAPSKVTVKLVDDDKNVKVSWTKVETATKYRIYRKEYENGTWSGWEKIKDTTAASYTDLEVRNAGKYMYTVRAYNKSGWGEKKDSKTIEIPLTVPAISYLDVSCNNNTIKLLWDNDYDLTEKFVLSKREHNGKTWGEWVSLGETKQTSYTDKNVEIGRKYQYSVQGYNKAGWGDICKSSSIVAKKAPGIPTVRINGYYNGLLELEWDEIAEADHYEIYRRIHFDDGSVGKWTNYMMVFEGRYEDRGLNSSYSYDYRVRSYNENGGYSNFSSTVTVDMKSFVNTPADLLLTVQKKGVQISWGKVESAEKYGVYRCEVNAAGSDYWEALTEELTSASYIDTGVKENTEYKYRVRAYSKTLGWSGYSKEKTIRVTILKTPAPTNLKAEIPTSKTNIIVSWDYDNNNSYYQLQFSEYNGTGWNKWETPQNAQKIYSYKYSHDEIPAGIKYRYRVRAYRSDFGWSDYTVLDEPTELYRSYIASGPTEQYTIDYDYYYESSSQAYFGILQHALTEDTFTIYCRAEYNTDLLPYNVMKNVPQIKSMVFIPAHSFVDNGLTVMKYSRIELQIF